MVGPQTEECGKPLKTEKDKLFFIECQKLCILDCRGPGDVIFLHYDDSPFLLQVGVGAEHINAIRKQADSSWAAVLVGLVFSHSSLP